jgi:GC-rich sequence DNA-binding factor
MILAAGASCVAPEPPTPRAGGVLNLDADLPQPLPDAAAAAAASIAAAAGGEAVQQYSRRRREALELAPTMFADADEQYASLTAVKGRLEGFKARYPREYGQAYVGESAAALFAPYVRLQLLQWEPLPLGAGGDLQQQDQQHPAAAGPAAAANGAPAQQPRAGFDMQDWYQQLFEYGLGAGDAAGAAAAAAGGADDADANLVPQLVESLILPMALTLVDK